MKTSFFWLSVLFSGIIVAQDVSVTSWKINTDGHQAQYYASDGTTVTNLNDSSGVQEVCYNSDTLYIRTNILADYIMGPWPGDPFLADGQDNSYLFPYQPTYPSSQHQNKPVGIMGLLVNGVALFDDGDGKSYNSTTQTNANNGDGVWNQIAWIAHASEMDEGNAHPDPKNIYHNHSNPVKLCDVSLGTEHSPIIGWSFDGWPIYGPFGYSSAMDNTSALKRMTPSWALRNITSRTTLYDGTTASQTGPVVNTTFPLGIYIEDYEYTASSGDLDYYNGRYCVTPEYPSGTYAYFLNTDVNGNAQYPNMIGPKYYGTIFLANFGTTSGSAAKPVQNVSCYEDSGVGIQEKVNVSEKITLYPNPTEKLINLQIEGTQNSIYEIKIINAVGKIVWSSFYEKPGISIEIGDRIKPGMYWVEVQDKTGLLGTKKLLIE